MNKSMKNMAAGDFDALLLQVITENYNSNKEIQKSVDMNANYVFSMPLNPALSNHADEKISKIINSGKKSWWLLVKISTIIGTIGIIAFLIFNLSQKQNIGSEIEPDNNILPVIFSDSDESINKENVDTIYTEEQKNIIDIKFQEDEELETQITEFTNIKDITYLEINENLEIIKEKGIPAVHNIPDPSFNNRNVRYIPFDFEYAEKIDKKNNPDLKINMGNYALEGHLWDIPSSGKAFIPTYRGVPFNKVPMFDNNMTFISASYNQEIVDRIKGKFDITTFFSYEILRYRYGSALQSEYIKDFLSENNNYKLLQPFYICNTEVSNINYMEFLTWVAKYNQKDNKSALDKNMETYEYTFHKHNPEIEERFGINKINVFPDTLVWRQKLAYNEPLVEYYLRHPAYAQYPVVGISYWQALAYVDWLTFIWQTRLDEQNIQYTIEFDIPTEYEWELVANKVLYNYDFSNICLIDDNNICNLRIKNHEDNIIRQAVGLESLELFRYENRKDILVDIPMPYDVTSHAQTKYKNKGNIKNMEANVSEWTKMDYSPYWENYIEQIRKSMFEKKQSGYELALMIEKYFDDNYNDKNGKMIRGANWVDGRKIDHNINLIDAVFAKVFQDPDKQFSTVGFRYVARVSHKNEEKIAKKINIIGRNLEGIDYSSLKDKDTKKFNLPRGYSFISSDYKFNFKGEQIKIGAFWAKNTEVTNLEWMFFLNYLIENNRNEDLQKCIPNDKDWKIKMTYESGDKYVTSNKKMLDNSKNVYVTTFTKDFIVQNKLDKMYLTYFAFEPIVGISHEAARIYAKWLTEMSGIAIPEFRLPTEAEWEYMALGDKDENIYSWTGPYIRNAKGGFMARFNTSKFFQKKTEKFDSNTNTLIHTIENYTYDELKNMPEFQEIINNQNREFSYDMADSLWSKPLGPNMVSAFPENGFWLYDMCGNAAEMINTPDKTKGGSWASTACFLEIKNEEKWNGQPSDCVGFRLVREFYPRQQVKVNNANKK